MEMVTITDIKEMVMTTLRKTVREKDTFMPVAFLNGQKTAVVGCPFNEDNKYYAMEVLGSIVRKMQATDLFLVVDSYVRMLDNKDEANWVTNNWEIEKPTMFPEQLRQSALVINHIFPEDPTKNELTILVYDAKNNEVTIRQEETCRTFDGEILRSVMKGYNNSENYRMKGMN